MTVKATDSGAELSIIVTLILIVAEQVTCHSRVHQSRSVSICGSSNGHRMYVELGDKGIIQAKNTSTKICHVELITCPGCVISVTFSYLNLMTNCSKPRQKTENCLCDSSCEFVKVYEAPYDRTSAECFCSTRQQSVLAYRGNTRSLTIEYHHDHESSNKSGGFALSFISERNRQYFRGNPKRRVDPSKKYDGIVASPYFPNRYPQDLIQEYVIKCETDASTSCFVRLVFSDYLLAVSSIFEVFDWNGQRLFVVSGGLFRPRVVLSTGPSLLMRFYANGASDLGFKARYSFLTGDNYQGITVQPNTDCGGLVHNLGGGITMMDMVESGFKAYDCLWIIKLPDSYVEKTHLMIKVIQIEGLEGQLTIKEGITSEGAKVFSVQTNERNRNVSSEEFVTRLEVGFYVHLTGVFTKKTKLGIAYSPFGFKECEFGEDFSCANNRCIPQYLSCDGFDHCGDNSDESEACKIEWESETVDRRWYSREPNYYFPRSINGYSDVQTATLVFLVSILGFILLITSFMAVLYKMSSRAGSHRDIQDHLQTISNLLAETSRANSPDDPPLYEAPPDYDQIVKLEGPERSDRRKRKHEHRHRNRSSSRKRSKHHRSRTNMNHEEEDPLNPRGTQSSHVHDRNLLYGQSSSHNHSQIDGVNHNQNDLVSPSTSDLYVRGFSEGSHLNVSTMITSPSGGPYFQYIDDSPPQYSEQILPTKRQYKHWLLNHGIAMARELLTATRKRERNRLSSSLRKCHSQGLLQSLSDETDRCKLKQFRSDPFSRDYKNYGHFRRSKRGSQRRIIGVEDSGNVSDNGNCTRLFDRTPLEYMSPGSWREDGQSRERNIVKVWRSSDDVKDGISD